MPPFAFAGLAKLRRGQEAEFSTRSATGMPGDVDSFWRAASISKIVVGQIARRVFDDDDLSEDVSSYLGWSLRNPHFPEVPITLAGLLGHSSSLSDDAGYLVPAGVRLEDWFIERGDRVFRCKTPQTYMCYSNLGYLLLAAAAERAGGAKFDMLAQRVLVDWGVEGGFNWSGLGDGPRRRALPTYRRDETGFVAQIDEIVSGQGVSGPDGQQVFPSETLGEDVGLFSPQGGLRISLRGALRLACALRDVDATCLWRPDMGPGDHLGGLMQGYGWGLQVLDTPWFYPRPLIGHFANAYGFAGGVWYDREADLAFAYGLNGLEVGDEDDGLRREELSVFKWAQGQEG